MAHAPQRDFLRLNNTIRDYDWGSPGLISELLGRTPSSNSSAPSPEAEMWLGTHPGAPSHLSDTGESLIEVIAADSEHWLGAQATERFGVSLPFLTKILSAAKALSIQVHPTKAQAEAGFDAENAARIDPASSNRNYKDANHKPEMIYALTSFEALCGFAPAEKSAENLELLAALLGRQGATQAATRAATTVAELAQQVRSGDLHGTFSRILGSDPQIHEALAAINTLLADTDIPSDSAQRSEYLQVAALLNRDYPADPGILVAALLNHVTLSPGQALYLPAGNVHAYLHGTGIEVMAESDNVLRGGLTPKHIDVPELLKTVDFRELQVPLISPQSTALGQQLVVPGFDEFMLQVLDSDSAPGTTVTPLAQNGPLLVLVVQGTVVLDSPRGDVQLEQGDSVLVAAANAPVNAHVEPDEPYLAFAVTLPTQADPP